MNTFTTEFLLLLLAAHLAGTIPFGLLVSRAKGIDIRQHGSGNLGATNVGRVLGKKYGVLVLLLDAAKGASTSLAGLWFIQRHAGAFTDWPADLVWLGTGVACVLGNTFPFYLRFKGGKGVATALGVILGIYPYLTLPALVAFGIWVLVVLATRYVSLASILAASSLPLAFTVLALALDWPLSRHYPLLILTAVMAFIVVFRHRSNLSRLLSGTESRISWQRGSDR